MPALQIAASLEKMAWQEKELSIDSALKKFDRLWWSGLFQHSIYVLEDLRGLLGSCDQPVAACFSASLSFLVFSVTIFLSFFISLEAVYCYYIDLSVWYYSSVFLL